MRFKVDIRFRPTDFHISRIIRYFILVDLFLWGGWGFMAPIFSVFTVDHVVGGTIFAAGMTSALYWLVKSVLQVPIAVYLDRCEGDRMDLRVLIAGLLLAGFVAMAFPLAPNIWVLYLLSSLQGAAFALYTPSWSSVFSRHLDKNHYAFDWSLDSTTVGLSSGVAAILGGAIAAWFGFTAVFILTALFSFVSAFLLLSVPDLILPKATVAVQPILPNRAPGTIKS